MDIPDGNSQERPVDHELEWNLKVVQQIENILDTSEEANHPEIRALKPEGALSASFRRKDETGKPIQAVELIKMDPANPAHIGFYRLHAPPEFSNPIIAFKDYPERLTTPYGVLSGLVISEEKLYLVKNYYLFDHSGKAIKREEIDCISDLYAKTMSPEKVLAKFGKPGLDQMGEREGLSRVDFPIDPTTSRFVPLNAGDREKIEALLDQIEKGEFKD